jgi:predicted amidohydrolase YtcJ
MQIYTEHVSKSGGVEESKGEIKEGKKDSE